MTDLEILKALGAIFDPSKYVQTIELNGVNYVVAQRYNRHQVFVFDENDGGALLLGNI